MMIIKDEYCIFCSGFAGTGKNGGNVHCFVLIWLPVVLELHCRLRLERTLREVCSPASC